MDLPDRASRYLEMLEDFVRSRSTPLLEEARVQFFGVRELLRKSRVVLPPGEPSSEPVRSGHLQVSSHAGKISQSGYGAAGGSPPVKRKERR